MKSVITLAAFICIASLCFGQGFDREMQAAGKKFHKDSNKVGRTQYKKQNRVSTSGAGKSKLKETKGVSTLDGTKKKKKNKARRSKGHRH